MSSSETQQVGKQMIFEFKHALKWRSPASFGLPQEFEASFFSIERRTRIKDITRNKAQEEKTQNIVGKAPLWKI